jgi:hypothetical protein
MQVRGARARIASFVLLLTACSGADAVDIGSPDAARVLDATTRTTSGSSGGASGSSGGDDATSSPDATAGDDSTASDDGGDDGAVDASPEATTTDGGEGGTPPSFCSTICAGCCDKIGRCQEGSAASACGVAGSMCLDCSAHSCPLTTACCTSKGTCGCDAVLLGCN